MRLLDPFAEDGPRPERNGETFEPLALRANENLAPGQEAMRISRSSDGRKYWWRCTTCGVGQRRLGRDAIEIGWDHYISEHKETM